MQQVRTDITTDMADQTTVSSTNVSMATPLAPKNNQKIVLVVQIIILPVIVLGNSLILWAIKKSPSLRKVTYYLLGNLAVADLLFGIMLAIRVMVTFADMFSIQMCLVLNELGLVPVGSSISGVLLICVHNFNSVKSLRHLVKPGFNFKATWIMMAVSWFGWCILSISGYLTADTTAEINNRCFIGNGAYHRGFLATLSVVSIVHFVLIITFQACTIITIQQQRHYLQAQLHAQIQPHTNAVKLKILHRAARLSRIITVVLIVTIISWGPYTVALAVFVICPKVCGLTGGTLMSMTTFICINSMGNVFVYRLKSKEFRHAFNSILCCKSSIASLPDINALGIQGT